MSPVAPFKYDVFISYSSDDRPWAKQLADDLEKRNLSVFFDRTGLEVGKPWEGQLDTSIDLAQHLIVLWSKKAEQSDYVAYERTYFHLKSRESESNPDGSKRKELIILLEDPMPKVHNSKQMIPDLKEANAYAKGLEALDAELWGKVLGRIERTVRDNSGALRVLVAVLASNKESMSMLDLDKKYRFIGALNSVLPQMGIHSKEELLEFYGSEPAAWRPFGDRMTIMSVLDNLRNAVRDATDGKVEIDWEPIGRNFWSDDLEVAKLEAARLFKELSVVIIDPISLIDEAVSSVLDLIEGCFVNTRSAVMILTPFKMLEASASLRRLVEARANSFATLFYQPPVPPSSAFANFGTGVGDVVDMRRLVLLTLGQHFGSQKGTNHWTNM
jgi:hypothetical protein